MLYKQENITLVDEVRKTGRGNRVWIEILKFLAVLTPINLIMVFAGEAIKAALFQKSVINEEISMIIQLYECALGIGLVVLYCCCIEKRTFMSMGFMKRHVCKQYIKGACVGAMLISALVWMGVLFNTFIFNGFNVNLDKKYILISWRIFVAGILRRVSISWIFHDIYNQKNTIFVAVMVNSILFGLTHGFNNGFQVLALLNLILFGIFESIYLLKTGNIWGISAIHSMWNFIQGNIYGFNVSGMAQSQSIFIFKISNCEIFSGGTFGLEGSLLTTIVLLSAINMVILYNTALQLQ